MRSESLEITQAASKLVHVASEVARAFIGSPEVVEALLVALLARGHVLVEGVPGVAKTTLIKALSQALGVTFRRIQFTPDLLPSDITGTFVFDVRRSQFELRRGPIFAHVVLADEINRAPAKTQSALLEAMQEQQVTIEGETHLLEAPFWVLATQNPIEHQGTYPLPESQLDRFLMKVTVGYPTTADEKQVLLRYSQAPKAVQQAISEQEILAFQALAERVHVEDALVDYLLVLAQRTRQHRGIALGVSPRGALSLLWAAKARALLKGRDYVLPDDIKTLVLPVFAHRLLLASEAELDAVDVHALLRQILAETPVLNHP